MGAAVLCEPAEEGDGGLSQTSFLVGSLAQNSFCVCSMGCLLHKDLKTRDLPVGVPRDDVAIEARGDQQARVSVVLDVLHPARVSVQRAHLGVQLPQVPQRDGGVVRAGGKQTIVQEPSETHVSQHLDSQTAESIAESDKRRRRFQQAASST